MVEPSLLFTKADGIARLTFNRPEVRNEEAWAIEKSNAELTIRTEDAREGPLAFMEKRKAVFRGR